MAENIIANNLYYTNQKDIDDRQMIIEHVKQGNVLDIGCGSGDLLKQIKNSNLYGVELRDIQPKDVIIFNGLLDDFLISNRVKFDTIILSAVYHELFTFANPNDLSFLEFFNDLINQLSKHLKINGKIIIRDGILYDDCEIDYRIQFKKDDAYIKHQQYINIASKNKYHHIKTNIDAQMYEFLMTYVWSLNSQDTFERESNELFGCISDFILKQCDLNLIYREKYYRHSFDEYFGQLFNFPFPHTHQLIVLRKDV